MFVSIDLLLKKTSSSHILQDPSTQDRREASRQVLEQDLGEGLPYKRQSLYQGKIFAQFYIPLFE
jgi:hypothetical protein